MPAKSPTMPARSSWTQPGTACDQQIRSRSSPEAPGRTSSATAASRAAPAPRLVFPRSDVMGPRNSPPIKSAGPAGLRQARVASGWEAR